MLPWRYDEALSDVSKAFDDPRAILHTTDLTVEQKIELLQQWETDLRLMLVATEENMPGMAPGNTAELLRQVQQALDSLGVVEREPSAAATKSGG